MRINVTFNNILFYIFYINAEIKSLSIRMFYSLQKFSIFERDHNVIFEGLL